MQESRIVAFNSEIESILSNRIHEMYIVLFKKFKFDVNLVSKYIQFCFENVSKHTFYIRTLID